MMLAMIIRPQIMERGCMTPKRAFMTGKALAQSTTAPRSAARTHASPISLRAMPPPLSIFRPFPHECERLRHGARAGAIRQFHSRRWKGCPYSLSDSQNFRALAKKPSDWGELSFASCSNSRSSSFCRGVRLTGVSTST